MHSLIVSFIVANCVLTVFNKDNDDDDDDQGTKRLGGKTSRGQLTKRAETSINHILMPK